MCEREILYKYHYNGTTTTILHLLVKISFCERLTEILTEREFHSVNSKSGPRSNFCHKRLCETHKILLSVRATKTIDTSVKFE